jgi:DNA-binding transcriptional regulator YbjK
MLSFAVEAASEHIRALRSALAKAQQETQVVTTNLASTTEQHRVDVLALKDTVQQVS